MCFGVSEADTSEDQCSGQFYSEDDLKDLDGYAFAENCREVTVIEKPCDLECGVGRECRTIYDEDQCVCKDNCNDLSDKSQPLCASNNLTFKSECAMEVWKCENEYSALYKKYDGECQKNCRNVKCPLDTICMLVKNTGEPFCYPIQHCDLHDKEQICGTDGITYKNLCAMRLSPNIYGKIPSVAHKGQCGRQKSLKIYMGFSCNFMFTIV
ncbi:unnamed protein product [Didymodactylos carnosus]|uniref:Kazal-like domain-containing protein n=1 Tax=Didymodactylos carnosus TaxID=1234261 RepID=A0A815GE49_9BILA|nr:unnamed protein product [Didymodactylos carnosus]CAF1337460.1 unnamed protein product [Didymodactylos carnosus]CAF4046309.1 unnamed protein product [Didymodactylos carnosus]CAF4195959.1 unnamed protein product [Didymodactylos carnosus]